MGKFLIKAIIILSLLVMSNAYIATVVASSGSALYQMAEIMYRLKHFPSPQGKQTLKRLIDDSSTSARERIIAKAILSLQHKAVEPDKTQLKKLLDSAEASQDEKALAKIVYNLDHRPTGDDKKILQAILDRLK